MGLFGLGDAPAMPTTARSAAIKDENEKLKRENAELKAKLGGGSSFFGSASPPKPSESSHPASSMSPAKATIVVGDICEVFGLEQREDLNGKNARAIAHDPLKNVWHVLIEGQSKKVALRPENLKPPPAPSGTDVVPGAANRRAQRTARYAREEGASPPKAAGSAAKPPKPKTHRKLTPEEREAAIHRLCAPVAGRPPRAKAPVTARSPEAALFDSSLLSQASDDSPNKPVPIEERPDFIVPVGKRRHKS